VGQAAHSKWLVAVDQADTALSGYDYLPFGSRGSNLRGGVGPGDVGPGGVGPGGVGPGGVDEFPPSRGALGAEASLSKSERTSSRTNGLSWSGLSNDLTASFWSTSDLTGTTQNT